VRSEGFHVNEKSTDTIWDRVNNRAILQPERIMSMKNSNDAIGNRTCDLPARSAVSVTMYEKWEVHRCN